MASMTERQLINKLMELKSGIAVFTTKEKDAREALKQLECDMKEIGFPSIKKVEAEITKLKKTIDKKEQRLAKGMDELTAVIDEFEERL